MKTIPMSEFKNNVSSFILYPSGMWDIVLTDEEKPFAFAEITQDDVAVKDLTALGKILLKSDFSINAHRFTLDAKDEDVQAFIESSELYGDYVADYLVLD